MKLSKRKKTQSKGLKKPSLSTVLIGVIFVVGLGVMLYPTIADWWNSWHQSQMIAGYTEAVETMTQEDYDALFAQADEYNARRLDAGLPILESPLEGYEDTLNIGGTGIMGYVTIDKIDVELPIYHGTGEAVLQVGCGHLEGSSLPVGGESTHAVLSTHRGLPSAKLFTDLDELTEGDTFQVTVLNRVLTYEIDQIRIVLPKELEELDITPGMDYCTLMTCTPYGVNSHRMLLRGHRVETHDLLNLEQDASKINPLIVAIAIGLPLLLIVLTIMIIRAGKKKPDIPLAGLRDVETILPGTAASEQELPDTPLSDEELPPLDEPDEPEEPEEPSDWEEIEREEK